MYTIEDLNVRLLSELKEIADELEVKNYKKLAKKDLVYKILDQQALTPEANLPLKKEKKDKPLAETKSQNSKKDKLSYWIVFYPIPIPYYRFL